MISMCLSIFKQGWTGVPIFFLGIATLAFSQFAQNDDPESLNPEQLAQSITQEIEDQSSGIRTLEENLLSNKQEVGKRSIVSNLEFAEDSLGKGNDSVLGLFEKLSIAESTWSERKDEIEKGLNIAKERITDTEKIFTQLVSDFAGRMEEAKPAMLVVSTNLSRGKVELEALQTLYGNASEDLLSGMRNLFTESEELLGDSLPAPPDSTSSNVPTSSIGRGVISAIQANEAVPLTSASRFKGLVEQSNDSSSENSNEIILKLKSELVASKNVQSELSADTEGLQGDLRKAYREIVSLQANLKESQLMIEELERAKKTLWRTESGGAPSPETVSKQINNLEFELKQAREDLRQSRKSLFIEQERSNSMIRSITTELDRTRRELDSARIAAMNAGADSGRLTALEQELAQTKRALQMAQTAPDEEDASSYLILQEELKKALGEVTRMQIELGEKNDMENELIALKSSLEEISQNPSRAASPEYVNKLLSELTSARTQVADAKASSQIGRDELSLRIVELEKKLKETTDELNETKSNFEKTMESIAQRELDFATTIKRLEEDAQMAQDALMDSSAGDLPIIPFVENMERNLADSETKIKELSKNFESEQAKASDVIEGLRRELLAADMRQKRALEQLELREMDLTGKDKELRELEKEKKELKEELEVVSVIAGQLQDLNQVLEETKNSQGFQATSMDEMVDSLRDELNRAKLELALSKEENEKMREESSIKINSLEMQLSDARDELLFEQQKLAESNSVSKDLVMDLKAELDGTREEMVRMRRLGFDDTIETEQAVSQLQEALGTIRILQESLEESERVNLEVDNLRVELAEAMTTQIDELQDSEDEKMKLSQKISDLEAEILVLRTQGIGTEANRAETIASLNEELKSSQAQVNEINNRISQTENSEIATILELEEQLAQKSSENTELYAELEKERLAKGRTIELLENDLASALKQMEALELESNSLIDGEVAGVIEKLQEELISSQAKITEIEENIQETDASDMNSILQMENELQLVKDKNRQLSEALQMELLTKSKNIMNMNENDFENSAELISQLANAEEQLERMQSDNFSLQATIGELEKELARTIDLQKSEDALKSEASEEEIAMLKTKLEDSLENLSILEAGWDSSENGNRPLPEQLFSQLENDLADADSTIIDLQNLLNERDEKNRSILDELALANKKIDLINEDRKTDLNSLDLEDEEKLNLLNLELAASQEKINDLLAENKFEQEKRMEIDEKLNNAIEQLSILEKTKFPGEQPMQNQIDEIASLRKIMDQKDSKLVELDKELSKALDSLSQKEAELELLEAVKSEVIKDSMESPTYTLEQKDEFQNEIDELRGQLEALKNASMDSDDEAFTQLQDQLQKAVAESMNLQIELEETKKRLEISDSDGTTGAVRDQEVLDVLVNAQNSENEAQKRIDELTSALLESEQLRKEMKEMLELLSLPDSSEDKDLEMQKKFLSLQNELALLQEDLKTARDFDDPRVFDLEKQLQSSRDDGIKLNDEFKIALQDFGKLKEQLSILESENEKLREVAFSKAQKDAEEEVEKMRAEANAMARENDVLRNEMLEKDKRIDNLTEELANAQENITGISPDMASLRSQVVRLEGSVQIAKDNESKTKSELNLLKNQLSSANKKIEVLQGSLRDAQSISRGLPSRISVYSASPSTMADPSEISLKDSEINSLKNEISLLKTENESLARFPERKLLDEKIRDLNQKNLMVQIQLDQERSRVEDMKEQLVDARDIKKEVLERGKSANLKVGLLTEELGQARSRIDVLEKTLVNAREALRLFQRNANRPPQYTGISSNRSQSPAFQSLGSRNYTSNVSIPPSTQFRLTERSSGLEPFAKSEIKKIPQGTSSLNLKVEVQFLDKKKKPAGFTEFFVVDKSIDSILGSLNLPIPRSDGIDSYAEYWARSIQRGYRFPGVASRIRNALAQSSLTRLKTNSIGEANLENLKSGKYFIIGASTLGQVGIVWSKPINLREGDNLVALDLRDAAWAE